MGEAPGSSQSSSSLSSSSSSSSAREKVRRAGAALLNEAVVAAERASGPIPVRHTAYTRPVPAVDELHARGQRRRSRRAQLQAIAGSAHRGGTRANVLRRFEARAGAIRSEQEADERGQKGQLREPTHTEAPAQTSQARDPWRRSSFHVVLRRFTALLPYDGAKLRSAELRTLSDAFCRASRQ